jgi:hypothetical protein
MRKLDRDFIGKNLLVCGATPKDKYHVSILYKDFTQEGINLIFVGSAPQLDIGAKT